MVLILEIIAGIIVILTFYNEIRKWVKKHQSKKKLFAIIEKMAKTEKSEFLLENGEYLLTEEDYLLRVKKTESLIRVTLTNELYEHLDRIILECEVRHGEVKMKKGWIRMSSPLYYKITEEFSLEMEKKFK